MASTASKPSSFNLHTAARLALLKYGFEPDFPPDAQRQLAALPAGPPPGLGPAKDLRNLLWSSIDDDQSRDLDQIEVAEAAGNGATRVRVAIADVDVLVPLGTPLDKHAAHNSTTVYTGVETFPMLPLTLSTDRTSLSLGQDRRAVVIDFTVASDGTVSGGDVYLAMVKNQGKLAYNGVGDWLAGKAPPPAPVAANSGLADQLRLQDQVAKRLQAVRAAHGALLFQTIEATPIVAGDQVTGFDVVRPSAARALIENFMIAANGVVSTFLASHNRNAMHRVVRTPQRWPRIVDIAKGLGTTLPDKPDGPALAAFLKARQAADPTHFPDLSLTIIKLMGHGEYVVEAPGDPLIGHFGLAVEDYTHGTAPNRRYADLVTQRLIKTAIAGAPAPYSDSDLNAIAARCTDQEDKARRAARLVRKQAAAVMLSSHVGETYDSIVTGATDDGTYVRIVAPPVEGRLMNPPAHTDVGDRLRVRLTSTDPQRGFIDFAVAKG
jgi:VacB/RNase II family 3'-5' exoribonuclease